MSLKVHGKGRSKGMSPEEMRKLATGLDVPRLKAERKEEAPGKRKSALKAERGRE